MSEDGALKLKPEIQFSPIYRGGDTEVMIREKYGVEEIVKLSSNENPLPTSPAVVTRLRQALEELNRYPPMGDEGLRAALAAYIGRGTTPENFVTGNGGCDILRMLADGFLTAGDEAIICPPTFPVYELVIKRAGGTAVAVPLREDYSLDVAGIHAAVTERTRLVFLCSPNNPTGTILTQSELDALMAGLPEGIVVVADEVYHHFTTDRAYANSYGYLGRNMVIVHSFSKVFGMAGLRLGYAIAQPEIAEYLWRLRLPFHLNTLTMVGGESGLSDRDHIEETVNLVVTEREKVERALAELAGQGVTYQPSQANFVLFKSPIPGGELVERLERRGSIARELRGFYMPGYCRVTIGLPEENDKFMRDLAAVLGES